MTELQDGRRVATESSVAELAEAFRGFWQAIVRHRREFVAVFFAVFVVVQVVAFLWPATYVARAAILIQKNRYSPGLDAAGERAPTVTSAGVSEQEVNSEIAVLTSRQVLDAAAKATGLGTLRPSIWTRIVFGPLWLYEDLHAWWHGAPALSDADRALQGMLRAISVEPMKESNVLVVSYEAGNPEFARLVLQSVVENYVQHDVTVHAHAHAEDFFQEQAGTLKSQLAQKEDALQALKRSIGVADLATELASQQDRVSKLREEQQRLWRSVAEMDQRATTFERSLAGGSKAMQTTTLEGRNELALQTLLQEKLRLELDRVRLLENYRPDSPLLQENQRKLDAAKAAIWAERTGVETKQSTLSPAAVVASQDLERARAEEAGYRQRINTLDDQLKEAVDRLSQLDQKSLEGKRLERLIATDEAQYMQYLRRGVEARIDAALDRDQFTNVSLVQQAASEPKPIRPRKLFMLILSFAAGLVVAVGAVVMLEFGQTSLEQVVGSLVPRPVIP
jgi:uncharacterized protein involved in exopolysaccharide biosynthesis